MSNKEINNQENEQEKEYQDAEIEEKEEIQEGVKDSANLAKNVSTGNYVGAAKDAIKLTKNKAVRRKVIKRVAIQLIVPILIIVLLASAILGIFDAVGDVVQGLIDGVEDFFNINESDGSINISNEQIDSIINSIAGLGVSAEDLKLLGDYSKDATEEEKQEALRKYIKKFYEAQLVTQTLNYYHKPSTDTKTYGAIYVYRTSAEKSDDENSRRALTYINYDKMLEMQEKNNTDALNYFSIDESGNLVIAGKTQTIVEKGSSADGLSKESDITVINLRSINYKSAVAQYTTQMNFLLYLTMISQNPEFVAALTDLIKDSRIEITVMDNVSTNINTNTLTYTQHRKWVETQTVGSGETQREVQVKRSSSTNVTEITRTTTITTTPSVKITYVKTWFCEQKVIYKKEIKERENHTTNTYPDESEPSGDTGSWKTNQKEQIDISIKDEEYEEYLREDVKIILGQRGDAERYANGEISEPTFIGLMETKFKLPYSTREEEAGSNIVSGAEMLFYLLQKDSKLENMEKIMRYALYLYTGKDYGVTELDGNIFNITDFISTGGGIWSALWDDSITREEFIELVEAYTPPNGTGNGGRSFRTCYNKYFVANAGNFYDICTRNGIDPRFIFCIGIHESAYGTSNIANEKGNFFGWGAYDSSPGESAVTFYDMSAGIDAVSSGLKEYTTPGTWQYEAISANGYDPTTIDGIGSLYASDPNWANAVKQYMTTIFGCTGIGANNGNIVSAAVSVHNYLRTNGYTYAQNGVNVPNTSGRTIDCSSYVTWVLVEAGVPGFTPGMYQWTSSTFGSNPKGWQTVSVDEAAPGDIVVYPGHVEIIAENISGNYFRVYNCGSNNSINASGTSELPESSRSGHSKSQATVILRVPMN